MTKSYPQEIRHEKQEKKESIIEQHNQTFLYYVLSTVSLFVKNRFIQVR